MRITNNANLPRAFVEMASRDYASEDGVYRVTALLKGIREHILERRHFSEIETDASDMIWLLLGTAAHKVLEQQIEGANELREIRLRVPVLDKVISGRFDSYDAETIVDYKTTTVWKIIFGEYDDWRRQLLIYAWMLEKSGFPVKQGKIVAILRDHSKRDAKYKADYPDKPVKVIEFDFGAEDYAEIEQWLIERVTLISDCEKLSDDDLPVCTPEERFNSGDKYAVMKKGRKTALRVLDSEDAAREWMQNNGGDTIEKRPGEDKKCAEYCNACKFCNYWRANYEKPVL